MKKFNKVISLILALVLAISLIPFNYSVAGSGVNDNADGGGHNNGGGSGGTSSDNQTGYRYYLLDMNTGKQVSNTVDILQDRVPNFTTGWIYIGSKYQSNLNITNIKVSNWDSILENPIDLGNGTTWTVLRFPDIRKLFKNSQPKPIIHTNGKGYSGNGIEFREWFMRGKASVHTGTGGGIYIKPNKVHNTTAGSNKLNKPGTSNGGSNSGTKNYAWALSSMNNLASNTYKTMHNTLYSYLKGAPKFSKYTFAEAYNAAVKRVTSYASDLFRNGAIEDTVDNRRIVASYASDIVDRLNHEMPGDGWKTTKNEYMFRLWKSTSYNTSKPQKSTSNSYVPAAKVPIIKTPGKASLFDSSFLLPVYAAETKAATHQNLEGADGYNIFEMLKLRDGSGKLYFLPLGMNEEQLEKNESGEPSVAATCAVKGYAVMVEPITWFKPASCTKNQATGKWELTKEAKSWFYGTPSNYGQLITSGRFNDGGQASWYWRFLNKGLANALRLKENLINIRDSSVITYAPTTGKDTGVSAKTLTDKTKGYAIHAYYFDYESGLPKTQTYDVTEIDPNPDPHPAPNPDPVTGKIPLKETEPKVPGTKPTKENPTPNDEGYLNTTRNIHIVKVYEKKKLDGNIEHVTTTYRENNPGNIDIVNEPKYKVVGYFTSPQFYDWLDGVQPINEYTPWGAFYYNEDIPKHLEEDDREGFDFCPKYNWVMDESKFDAQTWSSLIDERSGSADPMMATGVARGSVQIGVYYNPVEKGKEDLTDAEIAERYPAGCPYYDNTLYVRLLQVETPPSTHTWDDENYPEGDPGPAPDPEKDPENIKKENPELYNINIVKVYRTKDLNTGSYTHDGTYVRQENPKTIDIEDEPLYELTKWFISTDYINPGFSTTWEQVESGARVTDESGTKPARVNVEEPNTTLYVLLEKSERVAPQIKVTNKISESQLTKSISTSYILDGANWGNYWYQAYDEGAELIHTGGACACSDDDDGHDHSHGSVSHMTRADSGGDNKVWSKWTGLHAIQSIETKSKAQTEVFNSLVLSGGKEGREINLDKYNGNPDVVDDEEHTWKLDKNYTEETGISYFTTIWRGPYDPNVTLAKYKEDTIKKTMNASTWSNLSTLFPSGNQPKGERMKDRNKVYKNVLLTLGISEKDDTLISACNDIAHSCCCCTISPTSDTVNLVFTDSDGGDGTRIDFKGDFFILAYAGKSKPTASVTVTNMSGFAMAINGKTTKITSHFAKLGRSNFSFYPYIRMSYMETTDGFGKTGWTEPEYKTLRFNLGSADQKDYLKQRTTFVLSDKKSTIIPTNAVDVGWFNETQSTNGYGLQMTSAQWSVHARATSGTDWRQKNQVLPGGALYMLNTKGTETTVKAVTYSTLIENDSRKWITLSDNNEYTVESVVTENSNFIKEFKDCLEYLKIVQWVNKDWSVETPWSTRTGAVKVEKGGESLSELGLNTKANTDAKYLLFAGTANNEKGASEGDIDIQKQSYLTTVYKGFTDTEGNVYIAQAQMKLNNTELTNEQLKTLVSVLKDTNGTNKVAGTAADVTTKITKIGTKNTNTSQIIDSLKNNAQYNYLYMLDLKTGFITNLLTAVNRNQGDDELNAWVEDEKWYNEAFDGMYLVQQDITYQVGLLYPSKRTSVLDPNLCPAKSSTGDTLTTAFISQFRLNDKSYSEYAKNKDAGFVGTFYGIPVIMPDMENMYYTRQFYIPNANVQDLT